MTHAGQHPSLFYPFPELPSSPPPQIRDKVILQREYREKEGGCFTTLRDIIKRVTGDEPRTRYEILTKAIDLILLLSSPKQQSESGGQVAGDSTPHETYATVEHELEDAGLIDGGCPMQSAHLTGAAWQSDDAIMSYYDPQFNGQTYHFMPGMGSA